MKKWRKEVFPTNIKSLRDLAQAYKDIKIKKLHQDGKIDLRANLVTDSNGADHVIFYDPDFITKNFEE